MKFRYAAAGYGLGYVELMQSCWNQDPQQRPSFSLVLETLGCIHSIHKNHSSVRNIVKSLRNKEGIQMTSITDQLRTDSSALDLLSGVAGTGMFGEHDTRLSQCSQPSHHRNDTDCGDLTMTYDGNGFSRADEYNYMA